MSVTSIGRPEEGGTLLLCHLQQVPPDHLFRERDEGEGGKMVISHACSCPNSLRCLKMQCLLLWFPRICAGVRGVYIQSRLSDICLSETDTIISHPE